MTGYKGVVDFAIVLIDSPHRTFTQINRELVKLGNNFGVFGSHSGAHQSQHLVDEIGSGYSRDVGVVVGRRNLDDVGPNEVQAS